MTTSERVRRPARPQVVLEVVRTTQLTPHLIRLTLGGPGFAAFETNAFTDKYVKIVFAKPELGLTPPYDLVALRDTLAPEDLPVTRTYTVRSVNDAEGTLDIDFVVHGEEGIAGPWAGRAVPGETVVLSGPGGAFAPDPEADWYLFAGDESAIPAIDAALEALPRDARGLAFLEVESEDHRMEIQAPEGVRVIWVNRGPYNDDSKTVLAREIAASEWLPGTVQVFAHGERESMKGLRDEFLNRRGLERRQLSLSGYWAYGRAEDKFQAEKREPIGQVLP